MTLARVALIAALTTLVSGLAASAQDAGAPASESPSTEATPAEDAAKTELTDEERAEKQARKACKIKICDILATKDPQGDDVSCDIVKTWREVRHHQDAWRQVRLALGQGGLPVEARRQARAARERHDARRITRWLSPRRR